jgi:amino acid adenylation domain-containing protein
MTAANVQDVYELSPMQQGILFHTLRAPELGLYFVQTSLGLEGPLQLPLYREAWRLMVARHEVFRTSFHWEDLDKPVQVVHRAVELPWEEQDWTGVPEAEHEERLTAFLRADRERGFDFTRAPLLRLTAIRTGDDSHRIVISVHHLLVDGWSLALVMRDVFAAYDALSRGETPETRSGGRYRDYIAWLQGQELRAAEGYWRRTLRGFSAPNPLGLTPATDEETPELKGEERVPVPTEVVTALQALARAHRLTLNTVVQGAWSIVLSRYAGTDDVVFGATVSGRPPELPGVEEMVGMFINTLPVRVSVPGDARLLPWLEELQAAQAEARNYEYTPLVSVQGWSEVHRGESLFESTLAFENFPSGTSSDRSGAALRIRRARSVERSSYALSVMAVPSADRLLLKAIFDLRRFQPEGMKRMLAQFAVLLAGVAENPHRTLDALPMLGAEERREVLEEWNATDQPFPPATLHGLFEAQARRTPDALALVHGERRVTYRELDAMADGIAALLRRRGAGAEQRVGLLLERTPELIAALLGVLKSGAAYLPLDPAHPTDRLAYMVADSGARLILTHAPRRTAADTLAARMEGAAEVLAVEEAAQMDAVYTSRAEVDPEGLAYIYYTSGSTGRPKGVAMHHRGICNYVQWAVPAYGADRDGGAPVFTSVAVDLTLTNLLPLFAGRHVEMLPEGPALEELAARLRQGRAFAFIKITPTHLSLLNALLTPREAAGAAASLVIGADNLLAEPTRFWQEQAPRMRLLNEYGPTETVVGCAAYTLPPRRHRSGRVPIGRAIANLRMYVLDEHMQPAAVGVAGELCVGGAGVARGYLGRPGLTAERFVPDPFGESGARLYRTGDRARWRADGQMEFLGRLDLQAKVRGYRVELGEVEAVLREHAGVRAAAVVVRDGPTGDAGLVAYVVPSAALVPADLRVHLQRRVPEYMVPGAFVLMEELPLGTTGKLDPTRLPAPERPRPAPQPAQAPPRTGTERMLAGIWAEVLGVDDVGVDDNFFDLGGNSLLLFRVYGKLRGAYPGELSIVALLEHTTVGALARHLHIDQDGEAAAASLTESQQRAELRRATTLQRPRRGGTGGEA